LVKVIHRPAKTAQIQTAIEHMALSLHGDGWRFAALPGFCPSENEHVCQAYHDQQHLDEKGRIGNVMSVSNQKQQWETAQATFCSNPVPMARMKNGRKIDLGMLNVKDPSTGQGYRRYCVCHFPSGA
jgi:hypothetical protein